MVLVDRKTISPDYAACVSADNRAIGADVASYIASKFHGKARVVEFKGLMSTSPARERHEGFVSGMARMPDMEIAASTGGSWNTDNVARQVDSLLLAGTAFEAVFAHCDGVAIAASRRLKEKGRGDVMVVGVDGLTAPGGGLEAVEQGVIDASFAYPTGGDKIIQTVLRILENKPYEKDIVLASPVITPATARVYRVQTDLIGEREARLEVLARRLDQQLSHYYTQNYLLAACIAIIILIGTLLAVIYRALSHSRRRTEVLAQQKRKLEEQRDNLVALSKQLQESTQTKLAFFTNISHDLRTPLTLILAPLHELRAAEEIAPEHRKLLNLIDSNARMLLRLVTQTLNLRKHEAGELKPNCKAFDLNERFKRWCASFRPLAAKRMVRFTVSDLGDSATANYYADEGMMESVVYNLLSNAFKFTPEAGRVTARLARRDDDGEKGFVISVSDTGGGIEADKIAHVFERYYQADVTLEGTGIGLATVRTYVELHGGRVEVSSEAGKGAHFKVMLPDCADKPLPDAAEAAAAREEAPVGNADENTAKGIYDELETPAEVPADTDRTDPAGNDKRAMVLLVDDNADMRAYVRSLLADRYAVKEAADGAEGLRLARRLMPDVVVCDVKMPKLDGRELCRRLKSEWQTSHIPLMLLTACSLDEHHVAGYEAGADAYLSKPFNPDVFCSQLQALIDNRHRVRSFLGEGAESKLTMEAQLLDNGFAEHFKGVLMKNLHNADLNVASLGEEMGLSRTQLYRKVKQMTGSSPVELLRVMRLKHAAQMLRQTDLSVTEVAYKVGFSNPSYFTKCFREYFGTNPADYAKG